MRGQLFKFKLFNIKLFSQRLMAQQPEECWAVRHPLAHAACSSDPSRLRDLLSSLPHGSPSLDALDGEGRAPLHYACMNGLLPPTLALLGAGAVVDVRSGDRRSTPLHLAAGMNHAAVARALLAHGASPWATDCDRWTPLDLAKQNLFGNAAASEEAASVVADCDLLLDGSVGVLAAVHGEHRGVTPLMRAAALGAPLPPLLASAVARLDAVDSRGWSALTWAAFVGSTAAAEALCAAGADLRAVDERARSSPLMWAAQGAHVGVVGALLRAGAAVDAPVGGYTALMLAARDGHAAVPALLAAGAAPGAASPSGHTPLLLAATFCVCCRGRTVAALARAGAPLQHALPACGSTPLHLAAGAGSAESVAALCVAGADAGARDAGGRTPAEVADAAGCKDAAAVLREWAARGGAARGGVFAARPAVAFAAVAQLLEKAGVEHAWVEDE